MPRHSDLRLNRLPPQHAPTITCDLLERLSERPWEIARSVSCPDYHRPRTHTYSFPFSDDQIEEGSLANGLDLTSKAWQVSEIGFTLLPFTESESSDPIWGSLHVLRLSSTGKEHALARCKFLILQSHRLGNHGRTAAQSCNLRLLFEPQPD